MKRSPAPPRELERVFGPLEAGIAVTVIAAVPGLALCEGCQGKGMAYVCHAFREPPAGRVWELCKRCALARAGGPDALYVRTGLLRQQWATNARLTR